MACSLSLGSPHSLAPPNHCCRGLTSPCGRIPSRTQPKLRASSLPVSLSILLLCFNIFMATPSLWSDLVYLFLRICFVSYFPHQSVRSRKAGMSSFWFTATSSLPGNVPSTRGTQNICGMNEFMKRWELLQVRRYQLYSEMDSVWALG